MSKMGKILERHDESGEKLSVETFMPDRRDSQDEELIENVYALITGSSQSLRFLGELLVQFADGNEGGAFEMHPQGAGSVHFRAERKLGIYLLKKPC